MCGQICPRLSYSITVSLIAMLKHACSYIIFIIVALHAVDMHAIITAIDMQ